MVRRLSVDARTSILAAATQEAQHRGDRRVGTEHLLLGLLHGPDALAAETLGVDLASARAASTDLDRTALRAIGVDVGGFGSVSVGRARRRPPLTSGARDVLRRSLRAASAEGSRRIGTRHLLLALLSREAPDPAAQLLSALGVDRDGARRRLGSSPDEPTA
jgi:ATP-dependent Clp protease ATP-binding subunit ClpA